MATISVKRASLRAFLASRNSTSRAHSLCALTFGFRCAEPTHVPLVKVTLGLQGCASGFRGFCPVLDAAPS